MKEIWSERTLALVAAGVFVLGLGLDLATGDVDAPRPTTEISEELFETRASFCPPPFSSRTGTTTLALAGDPGAPTIVGIEPTASQNRELAADRTSLYNVSGPALEVVGYGRRLHAAALLSTEKPVVGAGAARCPRVVSDDWYFPEGSTKLGYDERLLIRNPFADEAVVSVRLYTSTGAITRANLNRIAVPAGESRFIKLNDYVTPRTQIGAAVIAERGRVVAWRALFADPEDRPDGVQFDLGATAPAETWYLPEGAVQTGIEEEISLLNPNGREAILSISLPTAGKPVQPPKLVEVRVPPESLKTISLPAVSQRGRTDVGGVGAIVTSTNGVGVVAERTVWYGAARTGTSSEIGSPKTGTNWMVLPAAASSADDSVVVLNPNPDPATISVTILTRDRGASKPGALRSVRVKGNARIRLVLNDYTDGQPVAIVVTSDIGVVAERVSSSGNGDVSTLMGNVFTP
ncbi:MAG: DUF5719 family protein [Actinomycetota bacterium]